jgi:aerobic C4-dicarboxylate transport protein
MKRIVSNLTVQVLVAISIGILVGTFFPGFSSIAKLISQAFINMISMLIAPIIFLTIVLGIAHMGDMKKVGRVGGKALLYFEILSTVAIIIGMVVANLIKPGLGVHPTVGDVAKLETYTKQAAGINWLEFFFHIIPNNIVASFTEGNILQILFFAILFGYGLNKMGTEGAPVLRGLDKLSKVFFNIMRLVMRLAPLGAFGGMAFSVGTYGLHALLPMAKLMGSVYLTCILFIFVVLNGICRLYKFSLWSYLKFIRQEILIVFGTSSSESVLPSYWLPEACGRSGHSYGLFFQSGWDCDLPFHGGHLPHSGFRHQPQHRSADFDFSYSDGYLQGCCRCNGQRLHCTGLNTNCSKDHAS